MAYKLLDENKIKHLEEQLDVALKDYDELQKRIDKAIYELQKPKTTDFNGIRVIYDKQVENALKVLKGEKDD